MAREAIARQYDVDHDSVVMKRLTHTGDYDQGTVTFKAKKGRLVSLDKLHESLWATRLSGGTKSGLVSFEVTAVGKVVSKRKEIVLTVTGSKEHFVLAEDPKDERKAVFEKMREAIGSDKRVFSVTGRLDGWSGRWPTVLRKLPPKPRRILVTGFETVKKE